LLLNTAEGALNTQEFEVIGIFQTFSKDFDARAVRISLAAAQELIGNRLANSVVVSLKSTSDTENVAASLRTLLDGKKLEIKTWQELNDFYSSTVALYERQFGVLQAIILMMVLLSVGNSVNMSAFERVGEFGTMMALGNNRLLIFKLVVVENTLLGAVGAVLGITIGIALALAISAIGIPMPPPPQRQYRLYGVDSGGAFGRRHRLRRRPDGDSPGRDLSRQPGCQDAGGRCAASESLG
jgi:putative ABC transport system permease protein